MITSSSGLEDAAVSMLSGPGAPRETEDSEEESEEEVGFVLRTLRRSYHFLRLLLSQVPLAKIQGLKKINLSG